MKTSPRIKYLVAALVLFPVAIVAFLLMPSKSEESAPSREVRVPETVEDTTLRITTDPGIVFQRAFWRRPGVEDKVLHAERLEWTNASGEVVKWQWFVVVESGAATQNWLAENPFGLRPDSGEVYSSDEAYRPEWFPAPTELREHHVLTSTNGRHKLATSKDGKRLYGTDSGFGFASSETP